MIRGYGLCSNFHILSQLRAFVLFENSSRHRIWKVSYSIFISFYCELQRSLVRMTEVICFKHFWTNVSKLAGIHDKEFEPTEASKISRSSVNKTDNFNLSVSSIFGQK